MISPSGKLGGAGMWHSSSGHGHGHSMGEAEMMAPPQQEEQQPLVAVAIDKDKGSQIALKWTMDHLVTRGQTLLLVHVLHKGSGSTAHSSASSSPSHSGSHEDGRQAKEVFLPFRCFCSLKQVNCQDVVLEDYDVAKAIIEFVSQSAIEKLVVGHSSKHGFVRRFKVADIPTSISKGAPDFCTVYIIQKGKVSSVRHAVRQAPTVSPFRQQIQSNGSLRREMSYNNLLSSGPRGESLHLNQHVLEDRESIKSPFARGGRGGISVTKTYGEMTMSDTDISFVSSGRPSTENPFPSLFRHSDGRPPRLSSASDNPDRSFELVNTPAHRSDGNLPRHDVSSAFSHDDSTDHGSASGWSTEDVETEMRRLRLELKQTMDMYNTACKEALNANKKAREMHRWKMEEEQKLQEARLAEETALAVAESEKAKCKAAIEAAEAAQRIAQLEAQKRATAELKVLNEAEEKKRALDALAASNLRCRKYAIEEIEVATEYFSDARKIGEGGYGPVYRCYLDHTHVAIKVLRPDAAQGRSQFQQEIEVLSCIRHPNMVLLLGACPEYGCLVYEYMANGSLDDRLFRRGNTPVLPWQLRFRIAAEIGTGLLFLHQTKPEPLVHRDLKPANILLDHNYVSKIGDVGLARLVPPSVADHVTQYRMTSTAGTFCYIDPEYQQTGMLGIKSDIYSLGIMLLQLITARPPMGLTHHVDRAIEGGTFEQMLDPAVLDWPVEAALRFAKMALRCAELRRKDRPDLGKEVLPEMERLRDLAQQQMNHGVLGWTTSSSSAHNSYTSSSMTHDVMSGHQVRASYDSNKSPTSVGKTVS